MTPNRAQPHRRGMALLLVLSVLAFATVMGAALLSSSALQVSVSANATSIAAAEALAESGVNYAMYQLQATTEEQIALGQFWTGQNGIDLGDGIDGTINVTVTRPDTSKQHYLVESIGAVGGISRRIRAKIEINLSFQPKHAVAFNGGLTLPLNMTVVGPLKSSGTVILVNSALMQGRVRAASIVGPPWPSDYEILGAGTPASVPSSHRSYLQYVYNGHTYNAERISANNIANATYNPNALTNPAGIFYTDQSITLGDNVTINGTLHVRRKDTSSTTNIGRLNIEGSNIVIRANSGFPALIVEERIRIGGNPRSCNVYGLVWTADGIIRGSLLQSGCTLNIYGALLNASTGTVLDALFNGKIRVEYRPEYLNVGDFSTSNNSPESVAVLSWERSGS